MGRLDGKIALVTGAARGQGEAEARMFASEGARVVLADVLDDEGRAVADDIGDAAHYVHLDVRDEAQWQAAVDECTGRFEGLHVLVNNAGIAKFGPVAMMPEEDYREVIDVNQVGVFLGMKTAVPAMVQTVASSDRGGSMINVSSVDGMIGMLGVVAYVASKFAVRGMTKTAALELGQFGIRVNSIHPGGVDTPMLDPAREIGVDLREIFARVPMGRVGTPEDVARLATFLASDESDYCTGTEFVIDGGLLAGISGEQLTGLPRASDALEG